MQGELKNTYTAEKHSCFIDTGVFFAAYSKRDSMHLEARLLLISAILGWFGKLYTSTYILDELATLTKAKVGGEEAVNLLEYILRSKKISIVSVEAGETLEDARGRFRKHEGIRGMSFTDCTTLAIQERMKINSLLSFDSNFRPLVPKLFGERYHENLEDGEREILAKATKKLEIV